MDVKERIIGLLRTVNRDGMENLISFLESSDFFTAPASTKYHSNFEGGLAQHSLNVYEKLLELTNGYDYNSDTLIICGLLHDICKTYFYTVEMRNKKDENGVWIQEPYYSVNDLMPLGHGEKSVIMISEFIKLTKEELYAIRWHMGLGEPEKNYSYISAAYNKYPLAVYLHVADLLSTYITEAKGGE